ncbi:MAG TPA: NAD(P)/FAD-dependent oxidoreductase [Anaeromyxobacteraceae bacterium]|nr:NAD(P)/FAD-dependent oxidoreductase [Anaeromyxobacteraceae bacterium]
MATTRPRLVIIGGGFAGLYCARALRRAPLHVTVVDRRNHHLFQPLLYQVATAGLNAADIAGPIRHVLRRQRNAEVLLGDVTDLDLRSRRVQLGDGESITYDFLVLATGVTHSYFGHPDWASLAPGLKTIEDALEIRRRVLSAFEYAERERDAARRGAWLTFVVIGGGPTGVELAGALAEIARHTLREDFRHFDPREARIVLLEGTDRVLPTYAPELSARAKQQLIELGVDVRTSSLVTAIDAEGVFCGAERIRTNTVLWGAGVQGSPLARALGVPLDRAGRVIVRPDLTVPGHDEVYVVGDLAAVAQEGRPPVPGVAPAAIQEGKHAARNVLASLRGEPRQPFRYVDKGSLATIGRAAAVADLRGLRLSGFVAWLAWLLVHIFFLIGFRNRVFVILQWAWHYATFDRGSRLITETAEQWRPSGQRATQVAVPGRSARAGAP